MQRIGSNRLFERSKKIFPGGVHSPVRAFRGVGGTPPFVQEASGAEIFDVDGNRYIDFCQSWGPLILGHRNSAVESAVQEAIQRGWSFGTAEPYSLELGELLTDRLPWIERLRFVNSGTEAVMSALRVARGVTGRDQILKFQGCYHGHMDGMLVQAGSGLAEMASPDSAGVPKKTAQDTLVLPLDDIDALKKLFDQHGDEIAAAIVEPLPANHGLLPQREEFLVELRRLTDRTGSVLIFDEVISGFRVAFGGMAEQTGIRPDLVTYGKIIGGGFPVGMYGGRSDLMSVVAPEGAVYQAGTLSANPVAMAAGIATLRQLEDGSAYTKLEELGQKLENGLRSVSSRHSIVRSGSLFWIIDFGDEAHSIIRQPNQIPAAHSENYPRLFHSLLEKGVYLAPSAFEVGFLSLAHTSKEIDLFVEAFQDSL